MSSQPLPAERRLHIIMSQLMPTLLHTLGRPGGLRLRIFNSQGVGFGAVRLPDVPGSFGLKLEFNRWKGPHTAESPGLAAFTLVSDLEIQYNLLERGIVCVYTTFRDNAAKQI